MNINEILKDEKYNFINDISNPMFLVFGGSIAYGTNTPESDIDIRGCALNPASDILLGKDFEQYIDDNTDTVIYSFNKLIGLLKNCNPNTIELLGCKPEHYAYISKEGQMLIDARKLFLSKKAMDSFGGYAFAQLTRLKNALSRNSVSEKTKTEKMLESCQSAVANLNDKYKKINDSDFKIYMEHTDKGYELFTDTNLSHYPLKDYTGLFVDLQNIVKQFNQLNKRNLKKDDIHLNKHAMHLLRLYLMCIDIFEKEEIITYREKDHDLLMSIRNGAYQLSQDHFDPAFFDLILKYKDKMDYAYEHTSLPDTPDYKAIDELQMEINRSIFK